MFVHVWSDRKQRRCSSQCSGCEAANGTNAYDLGHTWNQSREPNSTVALLSLTRQVSGFSTGCGTSSSSLRQKHCGLFFLPNPTQTPPLVLPFGRSFDLFTSHSLFRLGTSVSHPLIRRSLPVPRSLSPSVRPPHHSPSHTGPTWILRRRS